MAENFEMEKQLQESGQLMVREACSLTIESDQDYENAGKILVEIKTRIKAVTDYWSPLKKSASEAHKALCAREKEMLKPLTSAESIIKGTMISYQREAEKKRLQEAEEIRRKQQEETDRLLADAVRAQEDGDDLSAQINLQMAQMVNEMAPVSVATAPKAAGTSVKKVWKARVLNPEAVPAYVNGMEIRQIDMAALNRIAKMSNGKMTIPGVEFYEDAVMAVRS